MKLLVCLAGNYGSSKTSRAEASTRWSYHLRQPRAGDGRMVSSTHRTQLPVISPVPAQSHSTSIRISYVHALGDYVWTIRLFGTTDSYTTQIVGQLTSPFYE